jgi:hypothetical protein
VKSWNRFTTEHTEHTESLGEVAPSSLIAHRSSLITHRSSLITF